MFGKGVTMQSSATTPLSVYEALLHQYLDGRPIPPSGHNSSSAERDRAFFCHPLWETASREVFEHELFAIAFARYFRQETIANTSLLRHVATLAPEALMRAVRYAQLFLKLESPRWREMRELKSLDFGGLSDFIKLQEIINTEYQRLKSEVQRAESAVKTLTVFEVVLYFSLYGFQFLLPKRAQIDRLLQDIGDDNTSRPEHLAQTFEAGAAYDQQYTLATCAMRRILAWKLRTRPEGELQITEQVLTRVLSDHLSPLLSLVPVITQRNADRLKAMARLIQAHMDLQDFIDRSADSYSFNPDFNLALSPCRRYAVLHQNAPKTSTWDIDGEKLRHLETYWFTRAVLQSVVLGLTDADEPSDEDYERKQFARTKVLQSCLYLAEIYGVGDEVTLESGTRVDVALALRSGHLTAAFLQSAYIKPFAEYLAETSHWRIAMTLLAMEGAQTLENRMPLTWATRAEKAQRLISWTASERHPEGDLATSRAVLEFLTLDLKAWAERLRRDARADLPELYERPYLQFGEYLVQIPWLGAFRHTTNAAINQLRLTSTRRPGLRDETQAIEEQLGELLRARGFQVVLNYQPPRRDGEEDAGEVDIICQRDGHLFVIEVKSTYVRKSFREAWQHKYQTLRRAGLQVAKKCAAVCKALRDDTDLRNRLGLRRHGAAPAIHGWIVDTCVEHDRESFSGYLKVSLEEVLIVLRNERHLLLGLPEGTNDTTLYPNGFNGGRFAAIVEGGELWSTLATAGHQEYQCMAQSSCEG